jgi:DNA processing protein
MQPDALNAWLRLSITPGVGTTLGRKLLAAFGMPLAVFGQSQQALEQVVTPALAESLLRTPPELPELLAATLRWLDSPTSNPAVERQLVTLGDALYPSALLQTEDPPLLLYLMGVSAIWSQYAAYSIANSMPNAIAIVGARNPTAQGVQNAHSFAKSFSEAGWTVVSGMALGIDAAAHMGALDGGSPTIAVVGTGLDRVYPKAHYELAHRICEAGIMLSEFPIGTPPLTHHFPRRNRVISALSQGTLVVEAAVRSGSLITARMANEQGKEVFAIPGSIHSPMARGCHALIRQGAKLVESPQDVLEELRPMHDKASDCTIKNTTKKIAINDTNQASRDDLVLEFADHELLKILGYDPASLDALIARTGLAAPHLQAQLMALELEGHVTRLPGGLFARLVQT